MSIHSELEPLRPRELIEALSIQIYKPPLSSAHEHLHDISEPLRVVILILDFDTEVSMNGMLGFLENSTGLFLTETIEAFEKIGAPETTEILRSIARTLHKHGITPAKLRSDFAGSEPYQITTFRELHGDLGTLPAEVERDADRLYLNARVESPEPVWSLLDSFVERHRKDILAEVGRIAGE